MSDFIQKTLQRAIDSRERGGMQTGTPKVEVREAEAQRMIVEVKHLQQRNAELERDVDLAKYQCGSYRHERTAMGIQNEQLQQRNESLTRTAETLLSVLKRGDDPTAAMYQLEEVLSDAP